MEHVNLKGVLGLASQKPATLACSKDSSRTVPESDSDRFPTLRPSSASFIFVGMELSGGLSGWE